MDNLKLKLEIGDRKFEAEGPVDVVGAHANTFMKLTLGGNADTVAAEVEAAKARAASEDAAKNALRLDRMLSINGKTIALKILPKQLTDAVVILMLGHRTLRNQPMVSSADIVDGLSASGRATDRANYLLRICTHYGFVAAVGENRGRRYHLTEAGVKRAEAVARVLLAALPTPK
jgi:hypothetical protein